MSPVLGWLAATHWTGSAQVSWEQAAAFSVEMTVPEPFRPGMAYIGHAVHVRKTGYIVHGAVVPALTAAVRLSTGQSKIEGDGPQRGGWQRNMAVMGMASEEIFDLRPGQYAGACSGVQSAHFEQPASRHGSSGPRAPYAWNADR